MRIWQALRFSYVVFRAAWKFLRELDAQGAGRLSRANAKRDRRRTQRIALDFIDKKDVGLRKWVKIDDAAGPYLAEYLDSELVFAYLTADSTQERQKARQAILDGANGIDLHGSHP